MGLDVYLYRYDNFDKYHAAKKAHEKFEEQLWDDAGGYDKASKKQREEIDVASEAKRKELGILEYAETQQENPICCKVKIDSKVDPSHLFKVGYMRSSYNDGGINRILERTIGETLYSIFGHEGEEYHFKPDWGACLKRAIAARDALSAHVAKHGAFEVFDVTSFMLAQAPKSDVEALALFHRVNAEHPKPAVQDSDKPAPFRSFSCRDGHFSLDGLKVYALIPGMNTVLTPAPCTYAVVESEDGFGWYKTALSIVVEMCEWVLSQADPSKYVTRWSG